MTTRFNWTDPDTAKNEYGDFLATLQEELGRDQCILTDGSIMRPVPPPTVTPTGVAIDTLQLHGYQHAYRNCKADKCQAPGCNSGIPKDSTVCPNWTQHQDPSCKFKNTNWTGQTKRENDTTTLDQQEKKPKLAAAEIVEALMACLAAEKKP